MSDPPTIGQVPKWSRPHPAARDSLTTINLADLAPPGRATNLAALVEAALPRASRGALPVGQLYSDAIARRRRRNAALWLSSTPRSRSYNRSDRFARRQAGVGAGAVIGISALAAQNSTGERSAIRRGYCVLPPIVFSFIRGSGCELRNLV